MSDVPLIRLPERGSRARRGLVLAVTAGGLFIGALVADARARTVLRERVDRDRRELEAQAPRIDLTRTAVDVVEAVHAISPRVGTIEVGPSRVSFSVEDGELWRSVCLRVVVSGGTATVDANDGRC
jgi:hypothetical protein